jgi:hypothetical protein
VVGGQQSDRALVTRLARAQHRRAPIGAYRLRSPNDSLDMSARLSHLLARLSRFIIVIPFTILLLGRISGLGRIVRGLFDGLTSMFNSRTTFTNIQANAMVQWPEPTLETVMVELPPLKLTSFRNQTIFRPYGSKAAIQPREILTGRHKIRVTLLLVSMLISLLISFAVFNPGDGTTNDANPESWAYFVPIPFLVIAAVSYRAARRYANLGAHEVLLRDPRPLVLLLRSFKDDRVKIRVGGPRRRPWLDSVLHPRWDRFEEVVAWSLWQHGPVVAPSLPGQKLQPLGAARAQLSRDTWQEQIVHWMMQAQVIAVVLGRTDGLAWEISKIIELGLWERTVLVFPPISHSELRRRWSEFRHLTRRLGAPVPDIPTPTHILAIVPAVGPEMFALGAPKRDEAHYQLALKEGARYMQLPSI